MEQIDVETPVDAGLGELCQESSQIAESDPIKSPDSRLEQLGAENIQHEKQSPLLLWIKFARRKDVWAKILRKVLSNPVMIAIGIAFLLSLSTVGPTYLRPGSPDYVKALGWVLFTTTWLGDTVSPISLFTMGVWMQDQGEKMFRISPQDAFFFMLSKLILVPLLFLGLAKAFDLDNEAGRAAVLIAALPISLASFSVGNKYEIGESILAANVCLGTLLMVPTIIIWNVVMDAVDIFPIN